MNMKKNLFDRFEHAKICVNIGDNVFEKADVPTCIFLYKNCIENLIIFNMQIIEKRKQKILYGGVIQKKFRMMIVNRNSVEYLV